ncbi:hypothetical protein MA16_Dca005636 [Dendrobium catenatum]|uniref:Uncharacterized protein n=1 Tax=Dendrobium catenatum TaxID=906689 RepID=A0A2I0WQ64_9ASPA|nr:hypothetical protein MA16_Dca005636 [Dendrobium catenatum]
MSCLKEICTLNIPKRETNTELRRSHFGVGEEVDSSWSLSDERYDVGNPTEISGQQFLTLETPQDSKEVL